MSFKNFRRHGSRSRGGEGFAEATDSDFGIARSRDVQYSVRSGTGGSRDRPNGGVLLAALLDVRLDEFLRVLFEDGIDLVEEIV